MKTCILNIAAMALSLVLLGNSRADEEGKVVNPSLQGAWKIVTFSVDEGLNMDRVSNQIVKVSATQVTFPSGEHFAVKRVRYFTDALGHPMAWIFLSNGLVFEVSGEPGQTPVQVKILELVNDRVIEDCRFEATIENVTVKASEARQIH
jgi:hypothetical protein